jgi:hypothetical protein
VRSLMGGWASPAILQRATGEGRMLWAAPTPDFALAPCRVLSSWKPEKHKVQELLQMSSGARRWGLT